MPMRLDEGWNQIQFNLSDFTRRAYGTNYVETLRVQIHANCRIRRIYFSDRLYTEEELPAEFKLFLPSAAPAATNTTATAAVAADPEKKQKKTDTDWKEKSITVKKTEKKSVAEFKEREEKMEEKENSAENTHGLVESSQEKNETELTT